MNSLILIFGVAFCICLDTWNQIPFLWSEQSTITVYYYLFNSITYGGTYMPYLMPVIVACTYATSYVKESSGWMMNYLVGRSGYRTYAIGKIIVSIVGGGGVASLGVVLFCCIASCFKPIYIYEEGINTLYYTQPDNDHGIFYIAIIVYLVMLSGMFWSMVSLLFSSYFKNIYITIVSPLLVSFFLSRLYVHLGVPDAYRLDYWMYGREGIGDDKEMLILVTARIGMIIILMAYAFYRRIKKQEERE